MESSGLGLTKVPGSIIPDISEWDVVKSSEIRKDGENFKTELLAKTEGTKEVPGGHAEYAGRHEHMKEASYQGNGKNFVKAAAESSKTQTEEQVVIGGDNSGTVQKKSSSVSSSAEVKTSKQSSSNGNVILDPKKLHREFDQLIDPGIANLRLGRTHQQKEHQTSNLESTSSAVRREHQTREERHEERHEEHHQQKQHSQQTHSERYMAHNLADMDSYQRNVLNNNQNAEREHIKTKIMQKDTDLLAAEPEEIISRVIKHLNPNTIALNERKEKSTSHRMENQAEYVVGNKANIEIPEKRFTHVTHFLDKKTLHPFTDDSKYVENVRKQTSRQQEEHSRVEERSEKIVKEESVIKGNTAVVRREIGGLKI